MFWLEVFVVCAVSLLNIMFYDGSGGGLGVLR
jgi:hypothetical protein